MRRRLTIGLLHPQPGWLSLLRQLGLPFEIIRNTAGVSPEQHAVVVVNKPLAAEEAEVLDGYLQGGGSLLDEGEYLAHRAPGALRGRRGGTIFPAASDPLYADIGPADLPGRIHVHRDAAYLDGRIHLTSMKGGFLAHLPFGIDRLMRDRRHRRKRFYAPEGRHPGEVVAAVSRGALRRIVEKTLIRLYGMRGLPYLHLWYFPNNLPTIFCYRIDSDYGTREQVTAIDALAQRHGMAITWFLHTGAHQGWLDLFSRFNGQEIAVHGHRHITYDTYEENHANIAEAKYLLERAGFDPIGFAAPTGAWNPELDRAVEDLGFLYGSEFALACDDLPFYPYRTHRFSEVLQIPIHPVSIGNFLRIKATDREIVAYYRTVGAGKAALHEPIIFYHHPTHGRLDTVDDLFGWVAENGIENISCGDYARWWRLRNEVRFDAWDEGEKLHVEIDPAIPSVYLHAVLPDGRSRFVEHAGTFAHASFEFPAPQEPPPPLPEDIAAIRTFDLRSFRFVVEDFTSRMSQ